MGRRKHEADKDAPEAEPLLLDEVAVQGSRHVQPAIPPAVDLYAAPQQHEPPHLDLVGILLIYSFYSEFVGVVMVEVTGWTRECFPYQEKALGVCCPNKHQLHELFGAMSADATACAWFPAGLGELDRADREAAQHKQRAVQP